MKALLSLLALLCVLATGCGRNDEPQWLTIDREELHRTAPIELTPQNLQIAEAVFTRLLANAYASIWGDDAEDDNIKIDCYIIGFPDGAVPEQVVENLRKNTKLNVLSDLEGANTVYINNLREEEKEFLFCGINYIEMQDEKNAKVSCLVYYGPMAAAGYIYELRRKGSTWKVAKVFVTWVS